VRAGCSIINGRVTCIYNKCRMGVYSYHVSTIYVCFNVCYSFNRIALEYYARSCFTQPLNAKDPVAKAVYYTRSIVIQSSNCLREQLLLLFPLKSVRRRNGPTLGDYDIVYYVGTKSVSRFISLEVSPSLRLCENRFKCGFCPCQ